MGVRVGGASAVRCLGARRLRRAGKDSGCREGLTSGFGEGRIVIHLPLGRKLLPPALNRRRVMRLAILGSAEPLGLFLLYHQYPYHNIFTVNVGEVMTAKVAILLDGGFYLKRLPFVRRDLDVSDPEAVADSMRQLVDGHLRQINEVYGYSNPAQLLYRCFYYDAYPYAHKAHLPVSGRAIDYSKSGQARFGNRLLELLRSQPNFALRMGEVIKPSDSAWILKSSVQKRLLKGEIAVSDLKDDDFTANLRQKGVDMRVGLDIASLTLKKFVNIIVLVSSDSDFAPAARLARREGVIVILDSLRQGVAPDLSEHVDQMMDGFYNARGRAEPLGGQPPLRGQD